MTAFKHYLHSLKVGSKFFYTIIVDFLYAVVMWAIFTAGNGFIQRKGQEITGGLPTETFQQYVLSLPPEQMQAFAVQLKGFVFQLIGIVVLVPLSALLLFALSRAVIWNMIEDKNFTRKKYWKWNGVAIIMSLFFFITAIAAALVRSLTAGFPIVYAFVLVLIVVGFFLFLFVVHRRFVHSYKVFKSVGEAFEVLKQKRVWEVYGFGVLTFLVLQALQLPLRTWYFVHPTQGLVVQVAILLLYLGWLRLYVVSGLEL